MKLFWDAAKHRFLPAVGWLGCTVLSIFAGGILGIGIGFSCLLTGLVDSGGKLFTGWTFLIFPYVGGALGLIALHVVRVWYWKKLHRRLLSTHEGWTKKHTAGIILFDEVLWFAIFIAIFLLLSAVA